MRSGSGQTRRFNTFTLGGAARPQTAADRQLLEQGIAPAAYSGGFMRRAAKIRDRAD
jgi:hypothetical protein